MKYFYTYILECKDKTYYTGYTTDLLKRLKIHNEGKGAKYTRGRGPVKLLHFIKYESKSDAMRMEYIIKKMTKKQKEKLILEFGSY